MLEHSDDGALGVWCTGMLEHWDTGAHRRCNRKFECGNLVEFDLSADCVHECNCTRSPIFLSLVPLKFEFLSSFFNSLMNIMKTLGLIGQLCLTPSLQKKVCDTLVYSHNGLNSFIYTLIILGSSPCNLFLIRQ